MEKRQFKPAFTLGHLPGRGLSLRPHSGGMWACEGFRPCGRVLSCPAGEGSDEGGWVAYR